LENQSIIIDTSIFIDYFRKKNKKKSILYTLSTRFNLATSAVCYFEVFAGAKDSDIDFLYKMFGNIQIFTFDIASAHKASLIYQLLRKENKLIDFRDLFIASAALIHDQPLATLNEKHFERIPNLKLFSLD